MKKLVSIIFMFTSIVVFGQQSSTVMNAAANNTTVSTCDEFIIDSGGQGGSGYGNNENVTVTFCPSTLNDTIYLQFNLFDLDLTPDATGAVDSMIIYDGNSTAAPVIGSYTGNSVSSNTVFQASATNTSGCITIQFISNAVGPAGMYTAAVTCTAPCADPYAAGIISNGDTADSIAACVGEVINFADNGSIAQAGFSLVDYEWDFMDGTNANGQNVGHAYDSPGEYRVQLYVTDDNGCTNPNLIDLKVYVATEPTFTGFPADTTLCLGEQISLVATPQSYPVQWSGFPGSNSVTDGCLYDNMTGQAQTIDLIQTGFAAGATLSTISDLQSICLDIEHSFMGDLVISIECPNGQSVIMHQQGGGGTNLGIPVQATNIDCNDPATQGTPWTYCFTPTATTTWIAAPTVGGALPAGNYASVNPLSGLIGCPLNGTWSINVVDNWGIDDGMITTFAVNFDPSLYPPVTTFEPGIGNNSDSSYWDPASAMIGSITPDGNTLTTNITQAGAYTYDYYVVDDFGCTNDSSVVVTVEDNPQADAGMDTTICLSANNQVQLEGGIAGVSTCDYVLRLDDTWGDGWQGNSINVNINGTITNYTLTNAQNGGDWVEYTLSIPHGATYSLSFIGTGGNTNECEIILYDPTGGVVVQYGQNGQTPTSQTFTFVGDCLGDLDFEWTPSAILNDATISDPIATVSQQVTMYLNMYPTGHPLCNTTDSMVISIETTANPGNDTSILFCSYDAPEDLFTYLGPNAEQTNEQWLDTALNVIQMPFDPATMPSGTYAHVVGTSCTDTAFIDVTVVDFDIQITPTDITCNSANDGQVTITDPNGVTYTINGPGGAQFNQTGQFTNLAPGTYNVTVESLNGCTKDTMFALVEPAPLQLTAWPNDTIICDGFTLPVSAQGTGGSSQLVYTWYANGTQDQVGQNVSLTPTTSPTQYCVELSETCGSPTVTECFTIEFPEDIVADIQPDVNSGCYPVPVTFSNNTPSSDVASVTYDFGDGNIVTEDNLLDVSNVFENPGVYTVTVTTTSIYGCTYTEVFTDMIEVFDYPLANISVSPSEASMFDPNFSFTANGSVDATNLWWTFTGALDGSSTQWDPQVSYPDLEIGEYQVMLVVENDFGCQDTAYTTVSVVSDVVIYAPNAFTPDGDEYNQTFKVQIMGIDPYDFTLEIYNRWGELIFVSHDPDKGWDRTYQGKVVKDGAYAWTIRTKDRIDDNKYTWTGTISVIK
ncbi:PKD domain-containing protein [Lishizhenia sp.]|uniref:PKD domain-containing protein n=1 Tax=Lishizhenia sp. TaxID=2497594 RepID=UPI00299D1345|nr:PKD domain-containing protein [Lishizhenia sp.]MDX1445611.1 PKD domain-containing protein [Lishizhenia sp.]